jgi:transcriptional regulator with XRE-family HTH domain
MSARTTDSFPAVERRLRALGERVRLARLRRRVTATLLAERAGMSRPTLRAIERGDPGVTLGSIANVLHSLGLDADLDLVAADDELGRKLQDLALTPRSRDPRVTKTPKGAPR